MASLESALSRKVPFLLADGTFPRNMLEPAKRSRITMNTHSPRMDSLFFPATRTPGTAGPLLDFEFNDFEVMTI